MPAYEIEHLADDFEGEPDDDENEDDFQEVLDFDGGA